MRPGAFDVSIRKEKNEIYAPLIVTFCEVTLRSPRLVRPSFLHARTFEAQLYTIAAVVIYLVVNFDFRAEFFTHLPIKDKRRAGLQVLSQAKLGTF